MNKIIDGIRYHLDVWGNGFPLLLLHGFTGSSEDWRPFQPYWQEHSQVLALDIIGHGQTESPKEAEKYKIEEMAGTIASILDHFSIEQIDVLGYSMGGRLALTFAVTYPDRVRKLILESASPGLATNEERRNRQEQDRLLSEWIGEHGIEKFVTRWESIPLFESQRALPQSVRSRVRTARLANSKQGLMNSLVGMGTGSQPSWWKELTTLKMPVLLLTGVLDEKFCEIAENMKKQIEQCRLIQVENSGHAIHVEKQEMFGTIVSSFLEE